MEDTPTPTLRRHPLRRLLFWLIGLIGIVIIWMAFNSLTAPDGSPADQGTIPTGGLTVNVQDGQEFNEPVLTLTGFAPPEQLIFINGQPIPVGSDGAFELTLQLAEGPNLILIEAQDEAGGSTSLVRQVVYTLPGAPEPVFEPQPEPATGLLVLSLAVILLAVVIVLVRRRRPWINVSTDIPSFRPGAKGDGPVVSLIVEIDRTTRISLYLIDSSGRQVATLLNNRRRSAGRLTFPFDGYNAGERIPGGIYRIRAEAGVPMFRSVAETALTIDNREKQSVI